MGGAEQAAVVLGRVIGRGDLVLLDCSVVVHGYRGDFANTWAVGGRPTGQQIELAETCLEALKAGESVDQVIAWGNTELEGFI